jgi:hypothetical protein
LQDGEFDNNSRMVHSSVHKIDSTEKLDNGRELVYSAPKLRMSNKMAPEHCAKDVS